MCICGIKTIVCANFGQVPDAQIIRLDTRIDEEKKVFLVASVQLLTTEAFTLTIDGAVSEQHAKTFQKPVITFESQICEQVDGDVVPLDLHWKLIL